LNAKGSKVTCLDFHPFGEFFASGDSDSTLKIWDIKKTGCVQTYSGHKGDITDLSISPDGRWISTSSLDGTTKVPVGRS
jgi:katanin p80 WD40 repeat-containing subunit B1